MKIQIRSEFYEVSEEDLEKIKWGFVEYSEKESDIILSWEKTLYAHIDYEARERNEISQVNKRFDELVDSYFWDLWYSQAEIMTFSIQEDEASYIHWKSNPAKKESIFIRQLAEDRDEDFKELAWKIKKNSEASKKYIAKELAKKQKEIKKIREKYVSYK